MRTTIFLLWGMAKLLRFSVVYYEILTKSCEEFLYGALRTLQSVHPSVCHTFFTMFLSSYHHEIVRSYYKWKKCGPCKRSRSEVKVTEVKTHFSHFRTVTPVWIHIWWWNDAQCLMLLQGQLSNFKVIRLKKNRWFWPKLGVSGL